RRMGDPSTVALLAGANCRRGARGHRLSPYCRRRRTGTRDSKEEGGIAEFGGAARIGCPTKLPLLEIAAEVFEGALEVGHSLLQRGDSLSIRGAAAGRRRLRFRLFGHLHIAGQ